MKNQKNTVYFWLGIVALVLMAALLFYNMSGYSSAIDYYVDYYGGTYTAADIREMMPFSDYFSSIFADMQLPLIALAMLSMICFIGNSIVKCIKPFFAGVTFDYDEDGCDCGCHDENVKEVKSEGEIAAEKVKEEITEA